MMIRRRYLSMVSSLNMQRPLATMETDQSSENKVPTIGNKTKWRCWKDEDDDQDEDED